MSATEVKDRVAGPPAHPVTREHQILPPRWSDWFWRHARRVVVSVIGGTLLLLGVVGLFLPVLQGWLTIFGGLALLATEFAWARWVLKRARDQFNHVVDLARNGMGGNPQPKSPPDATPPK